MPKVQIAGHYVCFNCRDQRRDFNGRPYPKRTLEIRKPSRFNKKKKGKVIAKATVCQACFDEGHTKVPVGFRGFVPRRQIDPAILEMVKKHRAKALKQMEDEKQGSKPLYPQSSEPAASTPHGHGHKSRE